MFRNKLLFNQYMAEKSAVLKKRAVFFPAWIQVSILLLLSVFFVLTYPKADLNWLAGFSILSFILYYTLLLKKNDSQLDHLRFKAKDLLKIRRPAGTLPHTFTHTNLQKYFKNNRDGICFIEFSNATPSYLPVEAFMERLNADGFVSDCNQVFSQLIGFEDSRELTGRPIVEVPRLQLTDQHGVRVFERFAENNYSFLDAEIWASDEIQSYTVSVSCEVTQGNIESICVQIKTTEINNGKTSETSVDQVYKSIFEHSADGILLIQDDKITQCNSSALDIFKTQSTEFIGSTVQSILPLVQSDGALSTEKMDILIKNSLEGKHEIIKFQFQRPTGAVFDAEFQLQMIDENDEWILILRIRDITNRENSDNDMKKKVALEQVITSISTRFINLNPSQILREIQNAIKETADFLGLDRSYILLFAEDKSELSCISEYAANGLDEIRERLQRIPTTDMSDWIKRLSADQIQLQTQPELEKNSSYSCRKYLELTEAEVVLELPVKIADNLMGVMGFTSDDDGHEWTKDDVTMLKTIAEIIGHSMERRKMQQALRYRSELEKLVSEISNRFINISVDKINATIEDALSTIMRFTESDAAILYQFSQDMQTFRISNYAFENPEKFASVEFNEMRVTDYKWWLSAVFENEVRAISTIDQMPESATREREFSIKTGMNSGIDIPMVYQSKIIGVLSFLSHLDNRQWLDDEIALFRLISQVLTNALLRKESENKLRESEKSYRNIFENIRDVYYESTLDDIILEISPSISEVSKYYRSDLIGKPFSTIYANPEQSSLILAEIRKEKSISNYEIQIKSEADKITHLSVNAILINDEHGRPTKIVGSMRDISKNKLLEEQLQQAQKMEAIGTLAGGVAHDFNNLLTAIIGGSDLLLAKLDEIDPIAKRVRDIREAGDKASGLTRQLLAFSRKQVLEAKIININDLVNNLKRMLTRLISEDIELHSGINCENPIVKADPTQIEQVLINLVINARDAMPQGGQITICINNIKIDKTRKEFKDFVNAGDYVHLSVSDTGTGIKKELLDKVFDPFFTTKDRDKGTGLGLSMVYGIIKQHGGYIWAESKEGNGTVFNIYLPNVADPKSEPEFHTHSESNVKPGDETVLVAEDDKNVQRLVDYTLTSYGYHVILAKDVQDAVNVARKHGNKINLLLTDVIMPGLNGRQLFEKINAINSSIRVIYMSGYNDEVISEKGFLKSDVKFLQKPFTIADLARKVREVLDE